MKRAPFSKCLRRLSLTAAALVAFAVLYVVSSIPVSAWVANTVSGRSSAELNPSRYDKRLSAYWCFYAPVLELRAWLRVQTHAKSEELLYRFEKRFHRPRRLADGRRVITVPFWVDDLQPGEVPIEYVRRSMADVDHTLDARTEVYFLPHTQHMLLVLGSEDSMAATVISPICYITSSAFAELQLP